MTVVRLCDECSDPIDDIDNAHTEPVTDATNGYVYDELMWHPECCPSCAVDITDAAPPAANID